MSLLFKKNSKKFILVRLTLPAQEAVIGQTISVALGQYGVKSQEFIKEFNAKTNIYIKGLNVTCYVKVFKDTSFELYLKGPNISHLLKIFFIEKANDIKLDVLNNLIPLAFSIRPDLQISSKIAYAKVVYSTLCGKDFE